MLHNAQQLERYYTQKRTFKDFPDNENFPAKNLQQNQYFDIGFEGTPSDSGYILKAVPNKETNANETCTVYYNDSGIIWASSDKQNCPGYEMPKSE